VPRNDLYSKEQANVVFHLLLMPHCGQPPPPKMEETVLQVRQPAASALDMAARSFAVDVAASS